MISAQGIGNAGAAPGKRRIGVVAPLWTPIPPRDYGGSEFIVHLLVTELVPRGHDVTLFASGDSTTNAHLHPVVARNMFDEMLAGGAYEYEAYANAALSQALQHDPPFDVIHCHLGAAQIPFACASRVPIVFTLHTVPTADDRWMLQRFPNATVSAISAHQAAAFPSGRFAGTPTVVHHGIDFEAFRPSFAEGRYLAFLGRMGPHKSPLDAIRIARNAGLPLVLAGRPQNANETEYFEREIKPLIDGSQVRYIGPVGFEAKNELLANAIAVLFPIRGDEAFGLVMIEAMACGTPVLASARASAPEIVDAGVTGFTSDGVKALSELVGHAATLDRARVRECARLRFDHRRMVSDYEALYEHVIARAADAYRSSAGDPNRT